MYINEWRIAGTFLWSHTNSQMFTECLARLKVKNACDGDDWFGRVLYSKDNDKVLEFRLRQKIFESTDKLKAINEFMGG